MSKHLTLTVLFQGRNLNYGESVGTVGTLKKHYREGRVHSYLSRQALRYSLIEILADWDKKWKTQVEPEGKTTQYSYSAEIKDNPELDLFGYMKTKTGKSKKPKEGEEAKDVKAETMLRPAPVRISDATSVEAWSSEIAFNNNMGLMRRKEGGGDSDGLIPFQYESHFSWYTYTITIDLERIGKNENSEEVVIPAQDRAARIHTLLDGLKVLYRDIRGRREDLSPLFVIGGVTDTGNPIFYNLLKIDYKDNADKLNLKTITDKLDMTVPPANTAIRNSIHVGLVDGIFSNSEEIKETLPNVSTVEAFFKAIKEEVSKVYGAK